MLEILKLALETLSKLFDPEKIRQLRKEEQFNEIGKDLFMLYVRFNTFVAHGERLILILEEYLFLVDTKSVPSTTSYSRIVGYIEEQFKDIRVIMSLMRKFRVPLTILDAHDYRLLYKLIDVKTGILTQLLFLMKDKKLLIPQDDLLENLLLGPVFNPGTIFEIMMLRGEMLPHFVSLNDMWGEEDHRKIAHYLAVKHPRQQLDEMRTVLQQLYVVLKENFSIKDVLLEVGDERF